MGFLLYTASQRGLPLPAMHTTGLTQLEATYSQHHHYADVYSLFNLCARELCSGLQTQSPVLVKICTLISTEFTLPLVSPNI